MVSVFEIFKDKSGKFRFRLKAPNGKIIAVSESYNSKRNAINGIKAVCLHSTYAKLKFKL